MSICSYFENTFSGKEYLAVCSVPNSSSFELKIEQLNLIEQLFRFLFGWYSETHIATLKEHPELLISQEIANSSLAKLIDTVKTKIFPPIPLNPLVEEAYEKHNTLFEKDLYPSSSWSCISEFPGKISLGTSTIIHSNAEKVAPSLLVSPKPLMDPVHEGKLPYSINRMMLRIPLSPCSHRVWEIPILRGASGEIHFGLGQYSSVETLEELERLVLLVRQIADALFPDISVYCDVRWRTCKERNNDALGSFPSPAIGLSPQHAILKKAGWNFAGESTHLVFNREATNPSYPSGTVFSYTRDPALKGQGAHVHFDPTIRIHAYVKRMPLTHFSFKQEKS